MCQNQSLADSNAQIARDLRREVLDLMRAGQERRARSRSSWSRATASSCCTARRWNPKTWLLWFGPALLLLVGGFVIARIVRKRAATARPPPKTRTRSGDVAHVDVRHRGALLVLIVAGVAVAAAVARFAEAGARRSRCASVAGHGRAVPHGRHAGGARSAGTPSRPQTLADAITQLQAELRAEPDQPEGWRLLGQALGTEPAFRRSARRLRAGREAGAAAIPTCSPKPPKRAPWPTRAPLRRRSRRAAAQRAGGAAAAPARALVPRHRATPGRQRCGGGEDLGAAAGVVDAGTAPACARRSMPRARAGLPAACRRPRLSRRRAGSARRASRSIPNSPHAPACAATPASSSSRAPPAARRCRWPSNASVQELPLEVTLDDGDSPMPTQKLSRDAGSGSARAHLRERRCDSAGWRSGVGAYARDVACEGPVDVSIGCSSPVKRAHPALARRPNVGDLP